MPEYKITIEYEHRNGMNIERTRLDPLVVEAASFAEAMTHEQVEEAINRLDAQMVDKEVDSLPPELILETVASSAYLSSIQVYAEVYIQPA
jgi:hypothetical protein